MAEEVSVMVVGDGGGGGIARSMTVHVSRWISVRSCPFSSRDAWYVARRSLFMRFVTSDC
jgi:hypothetical protein